MKKNIWILNHYASEMFRDKSGRHFWFARKLLEYGYKPIVFCANTYHNKLEEVSTEGEKYVIKEDNGIPYVFIKTKLSCGNGIDRVKNMLYFYMNFFPVSKEIQKKYKKPDVILASSVHPLTLVAGIQAAKRMEIPCICEIRDLWPEAIFSFGKLKENSLIGKVLTAGEHCIYKKADALIFTKEGDTDYLREKGWFKDLGGDIEINKCHYINNGVNLMEFDKIGKENVLVDDDLHNGKFNIIYTGMLRTVNNVDLVLDCAEILKNEKDIQFLIYGSGNQLEVLRDRIEREKFWNVKIKGFVERKYVPYILRHSSVNLLNYSQSKYNWSRGNSSNKLFEYLASGKPIISTVKMGYDIIGKYECGISLKECTAKCMAEEILSIKELPVQKYEELCINARKAATNFDFDVLVRKLIFVIESVR